MKSDGIDLPRITRVDVITHEGREFSDETAHGVHLVLQDDGCTLKVFYVGEPADEE